MLPIYSIEVKTQTNINNGVPAIVVYVGNRKLLKVQDLLNTLEEYPEIKHVVFRGKDPLEHQKDFVKFLQAFWRDDLIITVEAKGNQPILNPLGVNYKINNYVVSINRENAEYDPKVLADYVMYSSNYYLRFDANKASDLDYVEQVYSEINAEIEKMDSQAASFYEKRLDKSHTLLFAHCLYNRSPEAEELGKCAQELSYKNNWRLFVVQ